MGLDLAVWAPDLQRKAAWDPDSVACAPGEEAWGPTLILW